MRVIPTATTLGAILSAAGASATGIGFDQAGDTLTVGVMSTIIGSIILSVCVVCSLLNRAGRPSAEAYADGYETGYSNGFGEGRRIARPVVVPLAKRCCGECVRRDMAEAEAGGGAS